MGQLGSLSLVGLTKTNRVRAAFDIMPPVLGLLIYLLATVAIGSGAAAVLS